MGQIKKKEDMVLIFAVKSTATLKPGKTTLSSLPENYFSSG